MTETEVIDKIHKLPESIQQHLYLYVDFLYHAYSDDPKTGNEGEHAKDFFEANKLSEAGKAFLEKRAEQALANPEKHIPWKEVRDRIHKKHNLPQ